MQTDKLIEGLRDLAPALGLIDFDREDAALLQEAADRLLQYEQSLDMFGNLLSEAQGEGSETQEELETLRAKVEQYEADRVHSHASLAAFQLSMIQMQAKLLSDAYDIFENSGEQNARAWHANIGRTVAASMKGKGYEQADELRRVTGQEKEAADANGQLH